MKRETKPRKPRVDLTVHIARVTLPWRFGPPDSTPFRFQGCVVLDTIPNRKSSGLERGAVQPEGLRLACMIFTFRVFYSALLHLLCKDGW